MLPREDPKLDEKMAIAGDKHLTDREKFEKLGMRRAYYQPGNIDAWTMRLDLRGGGGDA